MAERVGFEPTLEFPLNTLSKRAPSATRPSLRRRSIWEGTGAKIDLPSHAHSAAASFRFNFMGEVPESAT